MWKRACVVGAVAVSACAGGHGAMGDAASGRDVPPREDVPSAPVGALAGLPTHSPAAEGRFMTHDNCMSCHARPRGCCATRGGNDVSPPTLWRTSMKAVVGARPLLARGRRAGARGHAPRPRHHRERHLHPLPRPRGQRRRCRTRWRRSTSTTSPAGRPRRAPRPRGRHLHRLPPDHRARASAPPRATPAASCSTPSAAHLRPPRQPLHHAHDERRQLHPHRRRPT
jgi:hypothetical protein